MSAFTPLSATIGGVLIGCATTLYLWFTGRYAGLSGILRSAAFGDPDRAMDRSFVVGLLLGGALYYALRPMHEVTALDTSLWVVAAGGIIVGFGTALGNGCTSGHGVCGLGRLSLRSLVAVLVFLGTGMATVFVVRHLTGVA